MWVGITDFILRSAPGHTTTESYHGGVTGCFIVIYGTYFNLIEMT